MRSLKQFLFLWSFVLPVVLLAQDQNETLLEGLYNDPSLETQKAFVEELLYVAGYVPEQVEVYQSLPNYAHVFRITLDSVNGGFLFIRWDKKNKQHFVANKQIDPGFYYNLKTAQEAVRKQTNKASFSVDDTALQAPDQEKIGASDLKELRDEFSAKQKEKLKLEIALQKEKAQKEQRKFERKTLKKKN